MIGASISSLLAMNDTMFAQVIRAMQSISFEGVSGKVRFLANGSAHTAGDRIGSYDISQKIDDIYVPLVVFNRMP